MTTFGEKCPVLLLKIDSAEGAESFRLCNPPPFLAAPHLAALEIYDQV
jgi:hypothetical protein